MRPQRRREQNFWSRLHKKAEELRECACNNSPEDEALREFACRFQKASSNLNLLGEISEQALQNIQSARLDAIDTVETLLVGKGPEKDNGKAPDMAIQLAFDLPETSTLPQFYSQKVRECAKRILPMEQNDSGNKHPAEACAYTGKEQPLQSSTFPKVRLPILNKDFPLVSMFSAAACNKRYGLTDSLIVPVGKEVALQIQDALAWIVAKEREGKTWRGVASGKFETRQGRKRERFDLLVVYVDGKPDIVEPVASLFGTDEAEQQKQFEVDAGTICSALDGINKERPGSKLNIFLLRKASEGQAQVVLFESPLVEDILEAARWWQEASLNIPEILPIPFPQHTHRNPQTPYPEQIVRLLSEEWVTDGTRSNKVHSVGLGEVLTLMLHTPGKWEPIAQRLLDLSMRRLGPLLLGILGVVHSGASHRWEKYPPKSRETALRSVSTLGILLDAMGHRKEKYMNETAFLVGRLLALADTLHREYCLHIRNGDIPPQLMGNALMPVAADNPRETIDRLRERMMIYKAWADRGKGEVRLAKWAVGQIGELCFKLSQSPLPTETDQAFRAELLLGYMARTSTQKNTDERSIALEGE